MSKGNRALRMLREYEASLAPTPGMFSVLDEAIQQAPFERAPMGQWISYLRPGRMVRRGDVQFPLKQQELDLVSAFSAYDAGSMNVVDKSELLQFVREDRPSFRSSIGRERYDDKHGSQIVETYGGPDLLPESWIDMALEESSGDADDLEELTALSRVLSHDPKYGGEYGGERLRHVSPGSSYEEDVTKIGGLEWRSHFDPDTLSWSRVSLHDVPDGGGRVRLVDEIQSDVHGAAADRVFTDPETGQEYRSEHVARGALDEEGMARLQESRRGYMDPDELERLNDEIESAGERADNLLRKLMREERGSTDERVRAMENEHDAAVADLNRLHVIRRNLSTRPPANVPFKNPRDYAGLELRKQLAKAVEEGDDYLALTRGVDQMDRYSVEPGTQRAKGMEEMYDKVYLSELKKLARRYGAQMTEVEIPTIETMDARPPMMAALDLENHHDVMEYVYESVEEATDLSSYTEPLSELEQIVREIKRDIGPNEEMIFEDDSFLDDLLNTISVVRRSPEAWQDALADAHREAAEEFDFQVLSRFRPSGDIYKKVQEAMEGYYLFRTGDDQWASVSEARRKKFPAIHLTPEVRERIKEVGVPLVGAAGAAVVFEDDGSVTHYQRGGLVRPDRGSGRSYVPTAEELLGLSDEDLSVLHRVNEAESGGSARDRVLREMRADEEYLARLMSLPERALAGLESQWKTLDPETGEAVWRPAPVGAQAFEEGFVPEERAPAMAELAKEFRPNIVDETRMIPGLPGLFFPETFGEPPEWAVDAMMRSDAVNQSILRERGLPDPEGFLEHAAGGLGIMAGQVPVPGGPLAALGKRLGSRIPRRVGRFLRGATLVPRAAVEFLNPTVNPRLANYLAGAGFGGGLGVATDLMVEDDASAERMAELVELREAAREAWWESLSEEERIALLRRYGTDEDGVSIDAE